MCFAPFLVIAMSVSEEAIQTKDWGDPLLRPCKARKPMKGYAGSPLWPHAAHSRGRECRRTYSERLDGVCLLCGNRPIGPTPSGAMTCRVAWFEHFNRILVQYAGSGYLLSVGECSAFSRADSASSSAFISDFTDIWSLRMK